MATQLMDDAGLANHQGLCGLDEIEKIQRILTTEYQIKVYSKEHMDAMIYKGTFEFIVSESK